MNLMLGFPETTGLEQVALFPVSEGSSLESTDDPENRQHQHDLRR